MDKFGVHIAVYKFSSSTLPPTSSHASPMKPVIQLQIPVTLLQIPWSSSVQSSGHFFAESSHLSPAYSGVHSQIPVVLLHFPWSKFMQSSGQSLRKKIKSKCWLF